MRKNKTGLVGVPEPDPGSHRRGDSYVKVKFAEFDSIPAMAEQCRIPEGILRHAVKRGCPFKHHSRYSLVEFNEWFFAQKMDEKTRGDWDRFDKKMSGLIKEEKLGQMRKITIRTVAAREFLSVLVRELFFGELSRLAEEWPVRLKGKTDVQIHSECLLQIDRVRKTIEARLAGWVESLAQAAEDAEEAEEAGDGEPVGAEGEEDGDEAS